MTTASHGTSMRTAVRVALHRTATVPLGRWRARPTRHPAHSVAIIRRATARFGSHCPIVWRKMDACMLFRRELIPATAMVMANHSYLPTLYQHAHGGSGKDPLAFLYGHQIATKHFVWCVRCRALLDASSASPTGFFTGAHKAVQATVLVRGFPSLLQVGMYEITA